MNYEAIKLISVFSIIITLLIYIWKVPLRLLLNYLSSCKSTWFNKKVEKFRLIFQIIGLLLFLFSYVLWRKYEGNILEWKNILYISAFFLLFITGGGTIWISWHKSFKDKYEIFMKDKSKNTLIFKKDLNIEEEVERTIDIDKTFLKKSQKDLISFLKKEEQENSIYLIALAERSTEITYFPLFDFFNRICKNGIYDLNPEQIKELSKNIIDNFAKDKKNITIEQIKSSYYRWKKKQWPK